jgi:hypothetical protein
MDSSWRRVGRGALRAPGVRGADGVTWLNRAAVASAALAAAWCGFVALRPLDRPEAAAAETILDVPVLEREASSVDDRRARLARLNEWNIFDAEREAWSGRREKSVEQASTGGEPPDSPLREPTTHSVPLGGQSVQVTTAESLPSDVKTALTGLALRGIYSPAKGGEALALISRVHSGPNPLVSDVFKAGDEFEDAQHPQAKWRVIAIDGPGRRVILQRAGVNASLEMYAAGVASATAAPAAATVAPTGPSVVIQTKEEAIAALRAANIPEDQIKRLMELAEMSPDEAAASAALEELAQGAPVKAEQGKPARRPPPAGLEAIAKLLQQTPEEMRSKKKDREDER